MRRQTGYTGCCGLHIGRFVAKDEDTPSELKGYGGTENIDHANNR
jgi:hypothetical protein